MSSDGGLDDSYRFECCNVCRQTFHLETMFAVEDEVWCEDCTRRRIDLLKTLQLPPIPPIPDDPRQECVTSVTPRNSHDKIC